MARQPLITIGMPVRNGQAHLPQAIEAIRAQTLGDFELIISDNASDDRTQAICCDYAQQDSRIQYHRQPVNIGAAQNFNFTFWQARGRYFKWAAHDDLLAPTYLERCLDALRGQGSDAVLAFADRRVILPDGQYAQHCRTIRQALHADAQRVLSFADILRLPPDHFPPLIFGLIDVAALRRTRLMGDYPSADLVLVAELRLLGAFAEVPEPLYHQRRHGATRDWQQRATKQGEARWYNPRGNGGFRATSAGLLIEHLKAIHHIGRTPAQRMGAYVAMPRYFTARLARLVARRTLMRRMREEMSPQADPRLY